MYEQIQALGADLWAIAPQDSAQNEGLRRRRSLPFPILADADQAVIRDWGLFNYQDPKQRPIPYPAAYIIQSKRLVYWAHLGIGTRDRPSPGEIISTLRQLRTSKSGP